MLHIGEKTKLKNVIATFDDFDLSNDVITKISLFDLDLISNGNKFKIFISQTVRSRAIIYGRPL